LSPVVTDRRVGELAAGFSTVHRLGDLDAQEPAVGGNRRRQNAQDPENHGYSSLRNKIDRGFDQKLIEAVCGEDKGKLFILCETGVIQYRMNVPEILP